MLQSFLSDCRPFACSVFKVNETNKINKQTEKVSLHILTWSHSQHNEHRDASRKHLSFYKRFTCWSYANNYTRFIPRKKKQLRRSTVKSNNPRFGSLKAEVVPLIGQSVPSWLGHINRLFFLNGILQTQKFIIKSFVEKNSWLANKHLKKISIRFGSLIIIFCDIIYTPNQHNFNIYKKNPYCIIM